MKNPDGVKAVCLTRHEYIESQLVNGTIQGLLSGWAKTRKPRAGTGDVTLWIVETKKKNTLRLTTAEVETFIFGVCVGKGLW